VAHRAGTWCARAPAVGRRLGAACGLPAGQSPSPTPPPPKRISVQEPGRRKPRRTSPSASAARGSHGESSAPAWPCHVVAAAGLDPAPRNRQSRRARAPVSLRFPIRWRRSGRLPSTAFARMCAAAAVQARPAQQRHPAHRDCNVRSGPGRS